MSINMLSALPVPKTPTTRDRGLQTALQPRQALVRTGVPPQAGQRAGGVGCHGCATRNDSQHYTSNGGTVVRTVRLARGRHGYGFTVRSNPLGHTVVRHVDANGPADNDWRGVIAGDRILLVNNRNVAGEAFEAVVRLILTSPPDLVLRLARPQPRPSSPSYIRPAPRISTSAAWRAWREVSCAQAWPQPGPRTTERVDLNAAAAPTPDAIPPPVYSAVPQAGEVTVRLSPLVSCWPCRDPGRSGEHGQNDESATLMSEQSRRSHALGRQQRHTQESRQRDGLP